MKIYDVDFRKGKLNYTFDEGQEKQIKEIDALFKLVLERFSMLEISEEHKVDVAKILGKLLSLAKHTRYK